jgi:hypothetical protein
MAVLALVARVLFVAVVFDPGPYFSDEGISCAPVLLLSFLGAWWFRKRFWDLFPLYLIPIIITLAHLPFNITVRYRLAFEPFLILFAAAALVQLLSLRFSRLSPPNSE